ncbi:MAG: carboxypeptidase-like regulatory domain-containing protein [Planctomycetota bacterium]
MEGEQAAGERLEGQGLTGAESSGSTALRGLLVLAVICLIGVAAIQHWQGERMGGARDPGETERAPGVAGTVRDGHGRGIAEAAVAVLGVASTRTDADGRYRLATVPDGEYHFSIDAAGYAPVRAVRRVGQRVDFALRAARPLFGRVVDAQGEPLAGVYLDALRGGEHLTWKPGRTAADGRFRLPHADDGWWRLRVMPPAPQDSWRGPREWVVHAGDSPVTVRLVRAPAGRATLAAAVTGMPVRATLWRADVEPDGVVRTRPVELAFGAVRAEGLRPGRWRLKVTTADGGRAERGFVVGEKDTTVEVKLAPAAPGAIVGKVHVGDLDPLPPALEVWVSPRDEGRAPGARGRGRVRPDPESGVFRLEDVRSGEAVRLYLRGRFVWGEASVTVLPGGEARTAIRARPAGELVLASERPCPVAAITYAIDDGAERLAPSLAGKSDLVRLTLPPGPVRWRVRYYAPLSGDLRTAQGEATVSARGAVRVPLDLAGDR